MPESNLSVVELDETLSDVEAPALLPKNSYEGELQGVEVYGDSKGVDRYNMRFVIPESQFPADFDNESYPEGVVLYYGFLRAVTEEQRDRRTIYGVRSFMEKLGLPTNTRTIDPNEWMGAKVKLRIEHETWEGEDRMRIRGIEAIDGTGTVVQEKKTSSAGKKPAGRRGR